MSQAERPVAHPLHQQVRNLLMARITSGEWGPGTYLPPEIRLAENYGVAVGTLRKALLELARDGVVVRRQGKGTVVSSHDSDAALFRFFNLRRPDGSRVRPESRVLSRICRPAEPDEAEALGLAARARVVCITRVREGDGVPIIFEHILLDAARFAELETRPELLPNTLYQLYQIRFGATVHRARERIDATAAEGVCATELGLASGAPLMRIRRIAFDYAGAPLELRISWVHGSAVCYQTDV